MVNDDGRAVGVLSRSDVLRAVLAGADEAPVRDFMSQGVIAVQPDAEARQAAVFMVRCEVQRVFVVDEDGVPVGVVSTTDLLRTQGSLEQPRRSFLNARTGTPDTTHRRSLRHDRTPPPTRPPTARDLMRETELLIPLGMSIGAAGGLLDAAGGGVAPVVDSRGRCVGVFTAADYRRWLDRVGSDADLVRAPPSPHRHPPTRSASTSPAGSSPRCRTPGCKNSCTAWTGRRIRSWSSSTARRGREASSAPSMYWWRVRSHPVPSPQTRTAVVLAD